MSRLVSRLISRVATWPFELPPLPYDRAALAPLMSAETLDTHHGKHHAAYVEKLNGLVAGTNFSSRSLEEIILNSEGPLFDNAAQHSNHSFLWNCLSPDGGGDPKGPLEDALVTSWGSINGFREAFDATALGTFGSGWTWLVERNGGLEIMPTKDGDTPLTQAARPLLCLDVWEHAYYIDHRNDRAAYLANFWKLVNWRFVAENLRSVGAPTTSTAPTPVSPSKELP